MTGPTPPSIPLEVADLTCEWLAAALHAHAPGAVLREIAVLEAHSGTTGRARLGLSHDDPRLPRSVFVKLAPFDAARREFVTAYGMGVAEARFYAELARDVPVRVPSPWYAAHDGERYVMVLEDLTAAGARVPRPDDADLLVFVEGMVDRLAALHGSFWASPRFAAGGDLDWVARRSRGYGSAAALITFAREQLGDRLPAPSHCLAERYVPHADAVAALLARGTPTLVHGDAHLGNMFADGSTPGLLDWAVVGGAPGIRDLAYFLGGSIPTPTRRAEERGLVARYCERLAEAGIALDVDRAWEQYRLQTITAWIAAVVTASMGSSLQPLAVAMGAVSRANAAIEDLDVAGILAAELAAGR